MIFGPCHFICNGFMQALYAFADAVNRAVTVEWATDRQTDTQTSNYHMLGCVNQIYPSDVGSLAVLVWVIN